MFHYAVAVSALHLINPFYWKTFHDSKYIENIFQIIGLTEVEKVELWEKYFPETIQTYLKSQVNLFKWNIQYVGGYDREGATNKFPISSQRWPLVCQINLHLHVTSKRRENTCKLSCWQAINVVNESEPSIFVMIFIKHQEELSFVFQEL